MNKLQRKWTKDSLKYFLIFTAILILIWIPIHETSHFSVCRLSGNEAKAFLELPTPHVECEGIEDNCNLVKFIYFFIPYIIITIILLSIWFFQRNNKYVRIFGYVLVSDAMFNYIGSFFYTTDFTQILGNLGREYLFFTIPFLVIVTVVFFHLIKGDWKEVVKRYKKLKKSKKDK